MMSILTVVQSEQNISVGVRANESIHTDKLVYVMGEDITIYIHGDSNTLYWIYVDGHWYDFITTNATGDYIYGDTTYDFNVGTHTIDIRKNPNTVLASTKIEIRQGLEFWPSEYTHNTNKYLSGEILWVKLTGENNKEYLINITDNKGNVAYPAGGNHISVTTDRNGVAVFNVSLNIGDGYYSMNMYNGSSFIQSKHFEVSSVEITVKIDKSVYLLSERIHVFVTIYWMKNHAVLKGASYNWWFINASNPHENYGSYPEDKSDFYTQPLNRYENATGKKIGVNQEYILRVEYNETNSTGKHYARVDVHFYTGHLYANIVNTPLDGSLSPGKRVKTDLYTSVRCNPYGIYASLGNVNVNYLNITATKHWEILWYHNYTNLGKTNVAGHMDLIWRIPDVEIGTKVDINAQVSIENEKYNVQRTFYVESGATSSLQLDRDMYLSGDTMHIKVNVQAPSNVNAVNFEYEIYGGNKILFYESTGSSEITYTIPMNFSGVMSVYEKTYFSTGESYMDSKSVNVYYGYLYLHASQDYYDAAGQHIKIYADFESNVITPSQYIYKVIDDTGNMISETNGTSTIYNFTVPSMDSEYYEIMVEAINGNYYVSNYIILYRFFGFSITMTIPTQSTYPDRVYQPGQTIRINYKIVKYGNFTYHNLLLHWGIADTDYSWSKPITENDFQGAVDMTIPSDIRGHEIIWVWIDDSEGDYAGDVMDINVIGYDINAYISTPYKYQNMIYEPGERIKIRYDIEGYSNYTPSSLTLHWSIVGTHYNWSKVITSSELKGLISLKIPTDLIGEHVIKVWVEDQDGSVSNSELLGINVQHGSWAMQNIAGMPMAVFINLILVIIALVIGIVILFILLRGSGGFPAIKKKTAPKPFEVSKKEKPVKESEEFEGTGEADEEGLQP